jgi:hypothetical protein
MLNQQGVDVSDAMSSKIVVLNHTWFFFELILKSMAQFLKTTRKPKSVSFHFFKKNSLQTNVFNPFHFSFSRQNHFTKEFYDKLMQLMTQLCTEAVKFCSMDMAAQAAQARQLLLNLAYFLRDLMSFADRGQCFSIIHHVYGFVVCRAFSQTIDFCPGHTDCCIIQAVQL